jgi:hypothetical protein
MSKQASNGRRISQSPANGITVWAWLEALVNDRPGWQDLLE